MANKGYVDTNNKKIHRIDYATHWQLMLWKFRKNRMALIAVGVLGIFLIISLFAEFIAGTFTFGRLFTKWSKSVIR